MTTRQYNSGMRDSQRSQKSSQTVYVPKNLLNEDSNKQSESATQLDNTESSLNQNGSRLLTNEDETNQNSQNGDQNEHSYKPKSKNSINTESNGVDNKHYSRGGNQRYKTSYESSSSNAENNQGRNQYNNKNRKQSNQYTTYVPKSEENSSNLLTQSSTFTNDSSNQESNLTQSLHSSIYKSSNTENQRDGNIKPSFNKNKKYKYSENSTPKNKYKNPSERSSFRQYTQKESFGSNRFNNNDSFKQSNNQSSEQNGQFEEKSQNNRRFNRYDEYGQDVQRQNRRNQSEIRTKATQFRGLNKKSEDETENQQNIQQERVNFKLSSEDFQKQLEEKMLEFMRFHDPKTLVKKDYEKNLTREQKKANKIIRDSRKNHSIIKSQEGNPLIPTNWDGLEDVEQTYELLERKSLVNDISQSSVFGLENQQQGQFPSLLDESTRASRVGPSSSVKPSRKNSIQSSEAGKDGKDEFKETIEQIRQEMEQEERQRRSQYRSSHDIESFIESHEVIPEEEEECDNKQTDSKKSHSKGSTKNQGQRKSNKSNSQIKSNKREEYVRKDQAQKTEEIQQTQDISEDTKKDTENQQEKSQQNQQQINDQEDNELNMDLEISPEQTRKENKREERDLQSAFVENNEFYSEKKQNENEKNNSQTEGEENDDGVIQRISNLEDFVTQQMTAEEREAFERQYEDEQNEYLQKNQKQEQEQIQVNPNSNSNGSQQQDEQAELDQRHPNSNQEHQVLDSEHVELDDEPIESRQSCQSPPPTENITSQDVDQMSQRYDDEIVNVYTSQDSPVRVRKFSKKVNEEIVALEKQVVEQLKKEHMIDDYEMIASNENMQDETNGKLQTETIQQEHIQAEIKTEENERSDSLQNNTTPTPNNNTNDIDKMQTKQEETVDDQTVQIVRNENTQTPDLNKNEPDQTEEQTQEEVFEEIVYTDNTNRKAIQKEERDLQSAQGNQLDELLKEELHQEQQNEQQQSPQKCLKFDEKIEKTTPVLKVNGEDYNINSNHSIQKQNQTQTHDDSSSIKNNENGIQHYLQSDKNLDDTNHDAVSEYAKTDASFIRKQAKLLEQFQDSIKDISKSNSFFVNSIGSNIGTTFAGYVCNKVVASSLLKKGKLNQSYRTRSLFSSFSSYNSSIKH